MSKCPNLKCQHEDIDHFIDADDEMHGSCWATPTCDCDWNPHDIRQHNLASQLSTVTAERDALAKLGMWSCKACGPHVRSRANWCERGCGSDYNEMTWVSDGQSLADVRAEVKRLRGAVSEAQRFNQLAPFEPTHEGFMRNRETMAAILSDTSTEGEGT